MSRRYDGQTTTFAPDGRLYQIEYAMQAIDNAVPAVGILCKDGVVIAGEKKVASKLLAPPKSSEKLYKLDEHVSCAVAGYTADANILINYARVAAQRYRFTYNEPEPVEELVRTICDMKHGYTQYGGLRPFGVSLLFAGWDTKHGFQLYQSDPSGNYSGWKATAIGSNKESAQSLLKDKYEDEMKLDDALALAVKVLYKSMDTTTLTSERVEISTVTLNADGEPSQHELSSKEVDALIKQVEKENASEGDV